MASDPGRAQKGPRRGRPARPEAYIIAHAKRPGPVGPDPKLLDLGCADFRELFLPRRHVTKTQACNR
jgi:hypothetical protein